MGDTQKVVKTLFTPGPLGKALGFGQDTVLPGAQAAKQAAQKQTTLISGQRKKEEKLLKTSEEELKKKKAVATRTPAGRSLLIATSPTGVTSTLGGT